MRVFSYGGGVQSTAALVLAAQGKIDFQTFLFANTGDQAENPETLRYVHEVAMPYAEANGIQLSVLQKRNRAGEAVDLYEHLLRPIRSIDIPVRMANGAPGRRNCTNEFKIQVIAKWTKAHGATEENPATVGLGISVDEWHRAKDSRVTWQVSNFPLLDLSISRDACSAIIQDAGLPVPPKSACWFCPFKSQNDWQRMKRQQPDLFGRAVALERTLNERRAGLGKDQIYFHSKCKSLDVVVGDQMGFDELFGECDSGYCFEAGGD